MNELYEKYIDAPLNMLDRGAFFKRGIYYYLMLIAVGICLGGLYFVFAGLFGDHGYFSTGIFRSVSPEELAANPDYFPGVFVKIRSIVASIFTLILSVGIVAGVVAIFFKRSKDLNESEYGGLLEYLYKKMFPAIIKIYGECLALFPIIIGLMGFVSVLFVAFPYNPLGQHVREMYGLVQLDFVYSMMNVNVSRINGFGDYMSAFFINGLGGILMGVIMSFSMLISTYISIEIYSYVVKIIINIVKFIPKFAIPIWVQKSDRNQKRPTIDIKDI
jgi:hypothetical protein